jgi:hypothetical protein
MDVVSLTAEVANFGTFSSFPQATPKLVGPFPEKVIDVDGGYSFSLALTESGKIYSWYVILFYFRFVTFFSIHLSLLICSIFSVLYFFISFFINLFFCISYVVTVLSDSLGGSTKRDNSACRTASIRRIQCCSHTWRTSRL